MAGDGDGSAQAMAMLIEVEGTAIEPSGDVRPDSGFVPRRREAGEFGASATAALQRRIGAPRGARSRDVEAAVAALPGARPRTRVRRVPATLPQTAKPPAEPEQVLEEAALDASALKPSRVRNPQQHEFTGTVSVTVGPFDDLEPIGEFAEALSSIGGVGSVRIRTFDRQSVVFDVDLAEPTALISLLRGRSPGPLRLLYANERIVRLKLA
jgi:hypothetical protein